jgi:hypothetical protein
MKALPTLVDDYLCCAFVHGAPRKVAGKLFNQNAWDASKDEFGFVSKSQILDPRALEKARILGDVSLRVETLLVGPRSGCTFARWMLVAFTAL